MHRFWIEVIVAICIYLISEHGDDIIPALMAVLQ